MRILVIGADDDRVAWVEWIFLDEDVDLSFAGSGEEGIALAKSGGFELVILDPHMPDLSGSEVLKRFAENGVMAPVIIVSDQAGVENMSSGFGFGADAYITVPNVSDGTPCAASRELIACIYSLTGCTRKPPLVIKAGGATLEFNARWLKINGDRVLLSGSEFRIVELLARKRGETFSSEALCAYLHRGTEDGPEHKIVDFFISRARKLMAFHAAGQNFIETVWGKGYRFSEPKPGTP